MKLKVDGKEYIAIAMVNPKVLPLSMKDKTSEYYLEGKGGASYTLTLWKNGIYSLMDHSFRYRDRVKVEMA